MNNVLDRVAVIVIACMSVTAASAASADSNQRATTRPTTQPMLDGKVLSTGTAMPTTMPSAKSPIYTPAYGAGDGGGNKSTGVLLNGGIGPTVVPANGTRGVQSGSLPGIDEPSKMGAPSSQPTAR